jgi:hypothetical protein
MFRRNIKHFNQLFLVKNTLALDLKQDSEQILYPDPQLIWLSWIRIRILTANTDQDLDPVPLVMKLGNLTVHL